MTRGGVLECSLVPLGYDEAHARVVGGLVAQMPEALVPRTAREVAREPLEARSALGLGHEAEAGDASAHALLEVRLRPRPVRVEEAVDAVRGQHHRDDPARTERSFAGVEGR